MITTILAPLDGTEIAEAGLTWAEHAAARCGARLRLHTVVDQAAGDGDGRHDRAAAYLKQHCDRLQAKRLCAEFKVDFGIPAEGILAEMRAADLTVMTSATTRWLISAVLDHVLREMRRPVVVARGMPDGTPSPPNLSNILVPLDRGTYSLDILPMSLRVAKALGASIILCHAIPAMGQHRDATDAPPGVARIIEKETDESRRFLASAAKSMEGRGVDLETIVTMGDAPKEIIRIARASKAGLIAMATRGRDRLERRLVGSVANIVIESTNLPCLLARPGHGQ